MGGMDKNGMGRNPVPFLHFFTPCKMGGGGTQWDKMLCCGERTVEK